MQRLRVKLKARRHQYEIKVGSGVLSRLGQNAREWLGEDTHRLALISNKTVFTLYGMESVQSLKTAGFDVFPLLISDTETAKSLTTVGKTLHSLSDTNFERSDGVIALGGGVVGDVAGFTAAIYMRGIRFIQVPTTLLAQIDSSIGGKTGVNLSEGKNLVGVFHQPAGVLTDVNTLSSLPRRDLASGLFECVKQGVISGSRLFGQTLRLLSQLHKRDVQQLSSRFESLIAAQCRFKAGIVTGDEREDRTRTDHRSRRILNFGHTTAHALEAVTSYRRFRHGEAVGWGMLAAGHLSKDLGMLDAGELQSISEAVHLCGPLPPAHDLDELTILNAISHDKKRTAGSVNWVLLESIGKPRIVNGKEIAPRVLRQALRRALGQARN